MSTRYNPPSPQSQLDYWKHRLECLRALQETLGFDKKDAIEHCERIIIRLEIQACGVEIIDETTQKDF